MELFSIRRIFISNFKSDLSYSEVFFPEVIKFGRKNTKFDCAIEVIFDTFGTFSIHLIK